MEVTDPTAADKTAIKGIVYDIKRFAVHDGPGLRTTVFLKGCPLRCWWCQNPESQLLEPEKLDSEGQRRHNKWNAIDNGEMIGTEIGVESIIEEIEKDVIFYDESGGGATFSGGEPLMQPHFLETLLAACKEKDIHTAVDTSGYASWEVFEQIMPATDLFLYDIKLIDPSLHRKYVEADNAVILENLKKLDAADASYFVRIPLIPEVTDTAENLEAIRGFLSDLKNMRQLDLLSYNQLCEDKYRRFDIPLRLDKLQPQNENRMNEIRDFFSSLDVPIEIGG